MKNYYVYLFLVSKLQNENVAGITTLELWLFTQRQLHFEFSTW